MNASLNAGMSSGLRLVIKLPSITTSSSTTSAPAFARSVRIEGQLVTRRPSSTSASASSQGPWQIAAIGLPSSKNSLTISTARSFMRSLSGLPTPPGSRSAS